MLCDVSGSVAGFSHFTLLLVHALRQQFSRVRVFAFIDTTDEVTELFGPDADLAVAVQRITREAGVYTRDGHSDYGNAFVSFMDKWPNVLSPRSSLLVLGDGRNNYRNPETDLLAHMVNASRHAHWLNPEPKHLWGSGDSAVPRYQDVITMHECRSAKQLAAVIDQLLPVWDQYVAFVREVREDAATIDTQSALDAGSSPPGTPVSWLFVTSRRLGVMGGTFDPIHNGHLVAASEVADLFELDEVVFVPTGQPWQKHDRYVTAAEDRYLMTVIATASNPRFSVSRVDIDRGGPTYTKDTLRDLRAQNPDTELYFITGRRCAGIDPVVAELGGDVLDRQLRRRQPPGLRARRQAHQGGARGAAARCAHPRRGARAGDLVDRLPQACRQQTGRSGTWCPTASCST